MIKLIAIQSIEIKNQFFSGVSYSMISYSWDLLSLLLLPTSAFFCLPDLIFYCNLLYF